LIEDAHLRAVLTEWEACFAAWASNVPRQVPPARVWRRIRRTIEGGTQRRSFWRGLGVWQTATAAVAAALVAVVVWWQVVPTPVSPVPADIAVVTSKAGKPVWVVSLSPNTRTLTINATGHAAPPSGKAYELWMLPGHNAKPVSLGLLPAGGKSRRKLTAAQTRALASAKAVAVSVEPPGGSPTGQPTGPVVYSAPLVEG
jgi:anti-sigma-K factor RskA